MGLLDRTRIMEDFADATEDHPRRIPDLGEDAGDRAEH